MRRSDPTSPEVRDRVLLRDGYACIAPRVDPDSGRCGDIEGRPLRVGMLEVDHVRPEVGARTVSAERWMVSICPWHHRATIGGRNWATSHRAEVREYLEAMYGEG